MPAQVLSKRGKALLRRPGKISLAGDGLLERMRSTTFALLGITAALALGLVAIAAQQDWPDLPFSPLPGPAAKQGEVHGALVAAPPGDAGVGSAQPAAPALTAAAAAPTDGGGTDKSGSRLSESRQLEVPVAGEKPAADAPSGQDAAPPSSQVESPPSGSPTVAPTPTPESSPAPAAPAASPPSKPEPVAVSATKDLDQDKDKARASGESKSSSGKGGKSEKPEKSSEAEVKAPGPPAPSVVEPDEYAEEKEAAEGKDDSPTYRGKDRGKAYEHKGK
jgi:hypothetical protein